MNIRNTIAYYTSVDAQIERVMTDSGDRSQALRRAAAHPHRIIHIENQW